MEQRPSIAGVWVVWIVFFLCCGLVIPSQNPLVRIPAEILAYSLPLFAVWVFVRKHGFWKSIRITREKVSQSIFLSLALFLVFSLVIEGVNVGILHFMGKSEEEARREMEKYLENRTPAWYQKYLLVGSFFPVAFSEEAVFRGFVLWTLIPFGPVVSILASSILHLSLHLWYLDLEIAPLLFVQAFLLFICFGMASYLSGNIVGPILMHGLVNSLSVMAHFSKVAVEVIQAAIFFLGAISLFSLLMSYMRVRLERRIKKEMESQLELNLSRLRRMREGLRKMLTEIKRRYRRGEIKEEDFLRLKATYERRIKEVDRVLNRQKERTRSVQA
jgi:membrane protease YdiL (CAAX protease family)